MNRALPLSRPASSLARDVKDPANGDPATRRTMARLVALLASLVSRRIIRHFWPCCQPLLSLAQCFRMQTCGSLCVRVSPTVQVSGSLESRITASKVEGDRLSSFFFGVRQAWQTNGMHR